MERVFYLDPTKQIEKIKKTVIVFMWSTETQIWGAILLMDLSTYIYDKI